MEIKVMAPAKINFTLDIIRRRPDGYHDVSMVMQAIDLYDEVTIASNESRKITVSSDYPGVPCDKSNLCYRAADLFFDYARIENPGVHIDINKKIPTQAGMAGGSTDAAAVILGLNKLFSAYLKMRTMTELGARLGSDVPFCFEGGTRMAWDTGTEMKKLINFPNCHIVVCKPDVCVSTAEAYAKCDSMRFTHPPYTKEFVKALYMRDMYLITTSLYNDFEVALNLPEVAAVKKIMYGCKARGACMTGSGSAVYGIFTSEKRARRCVEELKKSYDKVFLCRPVKDGCKVVD